MNEINMKEDLEKLREYMQCICMVWKSNHKYKTLYELIRNMSYSGYVNDEGLIAIEAMLNIREDDYVVSHMRSELLEIQQHDALNGYKNQ